MGSTRCFATKASTSSGESRTERPIRWWATAPSEIQRQMILSLNEYKRAASGTDMRRLSVMGVSVFITTQLSYPKLDIASLFCITFLYQ